MPDIKKADIEGVSPVKDSAMGNMVQESRISNRVGETSKTFPDIFTMLFGLGENQKSLA